MSKLIRFMRDESGASAAEYVLIIAVIGSGIALAAIRLGEVIANSVDNTAACIETGGGSCPN